MTAAEPLGASSPVPSRPVPKVYGFKTICPATHGQCERFPVICAEVGCQDHEFRHLPRPPSEGSGT